jgi:hypothetical protein
LRSSAHTNRAHSGHPAAAQVEWLGGFLAKVDALVSRGDEACTLLQADYHEDKFRTFPHVNSPGWLIDQIVSKQVR